MPGLPELVALPTLALPIFRICGHFFHFGPHLRNDIACVLGELCDRHATLILGRQSSLDRRFCQRPHERLHDRGKESEADADSNSCHHISSPEDVFENRHAFLPIALIRPKRQLVASAPRGTSEQRGLDRAGSGLVHGGLETSMTTRSYGVVGPAIFAKDRECRRAQPGRSLRRSGAVMINTGLTGLVWFGRPPCDLPLSAEVVG